MRPGRPALAGVVLAALAGGLVATLLISRASSDRATERRAVKTYADAIRPLGVEGGRIVQQEIKPRLVDLRQGEVTPEQFRVEADKWVRRFHVLRRDFAATPYPSRLNRAADLYAEAMTGYITAIEAWITASRKPTQQARNDAIAAAADIADQADKTYDRAREALAREMRRVGLDPSGL